MISDEKFKNEQIKELRKLYRKVLDARSDPENDSIEQIEEAYYMKVNTLEELNVLPVKERVALEDGVEQAYKATKYNSNQDIKDRKINGQLSDRFSASIVSSNKDLVGVAADFVIYDKVTEKEIEFAVINGEDLYFSSQNPYVEDYDLITTYMYDVLSFDKYEELRGNVLNHEKDYIMHLDVERDLNIDIREYVRDEYLAEQIKDDNIDKLSAYEKALELGYPNIPEWDKSEHRKLKRNVEKVVAHQVDGKPMEFIDKEGEQHLKVIRNKQEMLEKIGDWATVHIQCDYELGASEMIASYDEESIKYEDEDVLNVAWFASQCNGITQDQYKNLFDKVNNRLKQNSANIEVVGDSEYGEKPYEISEMVGNFSKETIVYGYDELNALDNYGEYLEEIGFDVENDISYSEGELEEGNFYFANGYLPIDLGYIHMNEVDESYVNEIRKNSKQLWNDKEVSMEM